MAGLRGMDKRHITMYLPLICFSLIFNDPKVRIFDEITRLAMQLATVIEIIRSPVFSSDTTNKMEEEYRRLYFLFFLILFYPRSSNQH